MDSKDNDVYDTGLWESSSSPSINLFSTVPGPKPQPPEGSWMVLRSHSLKFLSDEETGAEGGWQDPGAMGDE